MYDDILIPYDGTEQADLGAEHGVALAASVGATVHALYVIDLPGAPRTVYVRDDEDELREEYREYGEDVTGDVCEMATEADTDCVAVLKSGSVHEEVADYAEENGIDLIVVGTPFRGKLGALLGGTSDRIVRTSPVPVTTVRESADPNA